MNNCRGYFVTGTDTGVGKTVVTLGLMQALQERGNTVVAMKPVASGCEPTPAGLCNEDALRLQQQASVELEYAQVNPCAFAPAIAPHLAAEQSGVQLNIDDIVSKYKELSRLSDCVLVEGAGGWQVPLNAEETLADLARAVGLEVILVVGLRLGCLNHALLSAQAISSQGCTLAGWVANHMLPDTAATTGIISTLESRLTCRGMGIIPYKTGLSAKFVANCLTI